MLFGKKKAPAPVAESRTAIRTQKDPDEIDLSSSEKMIVNRYDHLPRACKRVIDRVKPQPEGWMDLVRLMDEHPVGRHSHS